MRLSKTRSQLCIGDLLYKILPAQNHTETSLNNYDV